MIAIHQVTQGTAEWHEVRQGKYTGSNAHKLLKFGTINYSRSEQNNFRGNFYTKRGHILEDEALELYESIYGRQVLRPGFITNSSYPTCGYSPDGVDEEGNELWFVNHSGWLLEAKCFNEERHLAIANGEIPLEILAQIHFGMLICGLRKAKLILYNPEFAKKFIVVEGVQMPNPIYDPKLALVIIDIPFNQNIQNNFKRILRKEPTHELSAKA